MEDFMLTASLAIMGIYFVKKTKKNVGYILVAIGLIAEVASISTKFVNF